MTDKTPDPVSEDEWRAIGKLTDKLWRVIQAERPLPQVAFGASIRLAVAMIKVTESDEESERAIVEAARLDMLSMLSKLNKEPTK